MPNPTARELLIRFDGLRESRDQDRNTNDREHKQILDTLGDINEKLDKLPCAGHTTALEEQGKRLDKVETNHSNLLMASLAALVSAFLALAGIAYDLLRNK